MFSLLFLAFAVRCKELPRAGRVFGFLTGPSGSGIVSPEVGTALGIVSPAIGIGIDVAGAATKSNYASVFTSDSRNILSALNLLNQRMVKDNSVRPTTETIEWTQASRCWWSCEEEYKLVDYYLDGNKNGKPYKVFVESGTTPPSEFRTSGYNGKLHFGFLVFGSSPNGAVFFVIHPNSWGPYQHRFKTNSITKFVKNGLSRLGATAASSAAGAALGSIVPGIGTAIGAAVGAVAGAAGGELTDDYFGDYLRYIG